MTFPGVHPGGETVWISAFGCGLNGWYAGGVLGRPVLRLMAAEAARVVRADLREARPGRVSDQVFVIQGKNVLAAPCLRVAIPQHWPTFRE